MSLLGTIISSLCYQEIGGVQFRLQWTRILGYREELGEGADAQGTARGGESGWQQ